MKKIIFLLLSSLIIGCVSLESIRNTNRENLNKLSLGIDKKDVLLIMGTKTMKTNDGYSQSIVNNPYRTEILKGEDGNVYEIIFYFTDKKAADGAITDDELTPIILFENRVVGWGWSYLNTNVIKYQINTR